MATDSSQSTLSGHTCPECGPLDIVKQTPASERPYCPECGLILEGEKPKSLWDVTDLY